MKNILDLNSKVEQDFITYANAVIKSRAISSVEDNLKPVHRRVLYTMAENKLWPNKKTVKSSNIVGKVMIRHPHGDSSIYDAMIRLAQPWKMRYPLVEVQGNSGNILGDGPAAHRYTEARLSKFGEMMLEGIANKAVPFKASYDETTTEPVVLPSKFPNILCNGNAGIAVGISTSLVPHNLTEVVNAILAYISVKSITTDALMKHIPAPDFPTGGTIMNTGVMKEIYETGRGTIALRSKYRIEEVKGKTNIVITEIPYLITVETGVIDHLKKLVIEEGFDLIEDFENNTGRGGIELRIIVKKGANVYKVLEALWKNTRLQITQRISNTVIVDGNPEVLGLKEMISHYVKHRHNIIINTHKSDLSKTQARIKTVQALLGALGHIDKVIELVRSSNNKDDARKKLIAQLKFTEFQANTILEMKLSQLTKLDKLDLDVELLNLQKKEKELNEIITSEAKRETIMRKELLDMRVKYGDARRTTLVYGDAQEDYPIEDVKLLMLSNGAVYVTQKEMKALDFSKKTSPLNQAPIVLTMDTQTDKEISVFTQDGTMSRHKVLTMTTEQIESGLFESKPLAAYDLNAEVKDYIVFVTSGGMVKKTKTSEYVKAKNNTRTIKLKGDQELIFVGMANDDDNLAILDGKLGFFKVKNITATSKLTIGSKGLHSGKAIGAAIISDKEKLLLINADGKGKHTFAKDLVQTAKGGNGQTLAPDTVLIHAGRKTYFMYDGIKNNLYIKPILSKGKTAVGSKIMTKVPIIVAG